jgi:hypothetical protein
MANPEKFREFYISNKAKIFNENTMRFDYLEPEYCVISYNEQKLYLDKIVVDGSNYYYPSKIIQNVYPFYSQDSKKFFYVYNGDLFELVFSENKIKKVSSDIINGYDKNKLSKIHNEDFAFSWVSQDTLSPNQDGSLIAYYSNRRLFGQKLYCSDIWMNDLNNNDEYIVAKDARILGWYKNSLIYSFADGNGGVWSFDPLTKTSTKISDENWGFRDSGYLYNIENSRIVLHNISTGDTSIINNPNNSYNFGTDVYISNDNAVVNNIDQGPQHNIGIIYIDIKNNKVKEIKLPDIQYKSFWINGLLAEKYLAVTFYTDNASVTELIDIEKEKFIK